MSFAKFLIVFNKGLFILCPFVIVVMTLLQIKQQDSNWFSLRKDPLNLTASVALMNCGGIHSVKCNDPLVKVSLYGSSYRDYFKKLLGVIETDYYGDEIMFFNFDRGLKLEKYILDMLEKIQGIAIKRELFYQHKIYQNFYASPDGESELTPEVLRKIYGITSARSWKVGYEVKAPYHIVADKMSLEYLMQTLWQSYVCGYDAVVFASYNFKCDSMRAFLIVSNQEVNDFLFQKVAIHLGGLKRALEQKEKFLRLNPQGDLRNMAINYPLFTPTPLPWFQLRQIEELSGEMWSEKKNFQTLRQDMERLYKDIERIHRKRKEYTHDHTEEFSLVNETKKSVK